MMSTIPADIQALLDGKAKPVGSLGRLETLAAEIAGIRESTAPRLGLAMLVVFAADHGITAERVTAYPAEVSGLVAQLVLDGRAGASIAAKAGGAGVMLVDAGLLRPLSDHPLLLARRMGAGTANFRHEPAMSVHTVISALEAGRETADRLADDGVDILALGEIGIGNSSAAALIVHGLTGLPLARLVGPGAGLPPGGLASKHRVLSACYARAPETAPLGVLAEFGGFEIVMMAGAMARAPHNRQIVLVDGLIATAAAMAAIALDPAARSSMVFAHVSADPAHRVMLGHLGARPLLELDMRLGEGTGAALAIPLVRAAAGLLTDLADLKDVLP